MEHAQSASLRYLTVQDILWANLQATHAVQPYRYASLEEVTSYQYAYGGSRDVFGQAARFLGGFTKLSPFAHGNEATGLLACFAFLQLNGHRPVLPDAEGKAWLEKMRSGGEGAAVALQEVVEPSTAHAPETVESVVRSLIAAYPQTLASLREPAAATGA